MSQEQEIVLAEIIPEIEKPSVPWTILDVVLFLGLWLGLQLFVSVVIGVVLVATHSHDQLRAQAAGGEGYQHPVTQMIQMGKDAPIILLVAFVSVVVVAPIVEEFLFRFILQGWLEAKLLQFRIPCASGIAITITSLFFALIHAGDSGNLGVWPLFFLFLASSVMNVLLLLFGIIYLALLRNVNFIDYLFGTERFFRPGFIAVAGYCTLGILFCQGFGILLGYMYKDVNVTPIPIFFFALMLGTLYSKTKNLSYCILFHTCLNAVAMVLILL